MKKSNLFKTILLTLGVSILAFAGCKEACKHAYDNACDTVCNECTETREVIGHAYDNACDTVCNECTETREVIGHAYDNACDVACNECGETRFIQHDYSVLKTNESYHWYACSVCEREDGENKEKHTGGEATCQDKAKCSVCETAYGELNPDNHAEKGSHEYVEIAFLAYTYDCCNVVENHFESVTDDNCYCEQCDEIYHFLNSSCFCHTCDSYFHTLDETCFCAGCSLYLHGTVNSETGICTDCNLLGAAASVVVDGVKTYYATIENAVSAAEKKTCTIVLENDCKGVNNYVDIRGGNIVIDLNGKKLSSCSNYTLRTFGGTITIRDSVGTGEVTDTISVQSGTTIFESGKCKSLNVYDNATAKVYGGEMGDVSLNSSLKTLKLYGGRFEAVMVYTEKCSFADFLPNGYCFYDENGNEVDITNVEVNSRYWSYIYNVTVGEKVEPVDVSIALKQGAKVSYYWENGLTIDLSALLDITEGAGEVTYTLTSSKGSINGAILSCPLVAEYTITVTTAETATHKAGSFTFTIKVESDPNTGEFDGEWV